ncbi:hypothetical protein [Methylocapsa sp. S129]|uniref:hypothetical protein n=1 Tax=Methylocapsa sp. S129 TaxID=1641869 RepID=UPI00131CF7E6|nr:hypothetical protein [Methylocapsa sp. S129]
MSDLEVSTTLPISIPTAHARHQVGNASRMPSTERVTVMVWTALLQMVNGRFNDNHFGMALT